MIRPLLASLFLASTAAAATHLSATTQPMGTIDAAGSKFGVVVSPDQKHVATFHQQDKQVTAILDGKPQGKFDWIVPLSQVFSTDGSTLVYIAQTGSDMFIVQNGKPRKGYYQVLPPFLISTDGAHVAYEAGVSGGGGSVMLDDVAGPKLDQILYVALALDGSRMMSVGLRNGRAVVVDGTHEISPADIVTVPNPPLVTNDGKHIAYTYTTARGSFIVVDDKPAGPFESVLTGSPQLTPDGAHWFACVKSAGQVQLIDETGKVVDHGEQVGGLAISKDGKHVGYALRRDNHDSIVVDGKTVGTYSQGDLLSRSFLFSHDGLHTAFVARQSDTEQFVVLDGVPQKPQTHVEPPTFSPDDKHIAYFYNTGDKATHLMIDSMPVGEPMSKVVLESLTFSPDGKHVAYLGGSAGEKGGTLYIDGVPGPHFDAPLPSTHLVFDDAKTLRFVAGMGDGTILGFTVKVSE